VAMDALRQRVRLVNLALTLFIWILGNA
jgi:hypothetical protein